MSAQNVMQSHRAIASTHPVNAANRFGWDYTALADSFAKRARPIIDVHSHIGGDQAARIFQQAADAYGVGTVYTMVPMPYVATTRAALGDRVRFIAVPNYHSDNRKEEFGRGYVKTVEQFHAIGSRICKFWVAPRSVDYALEIGDAGFLRLDSPHKKDAMRAASALGMIFMVHVADPDTWFQARYTDANRYGTKQQQYEPFEACMEEYRHIPWIAAHMAGWPEDLEFLDGLMTRHSNLYLDTSACKWQVRELSKHDDNDLLTFFQKYHTRIMFGSDIVSTEEHLQPSDDESPMFHKASSPQEAFDLYASRYWAYRTMFETDYQGESPIADPDLAMVDPERFDVMSAPTLLGRDFPEQLLDWLYYRAAHELLEPLHVTN